MFRHLIEPLFRIDIDEVVLHVVDLVPSKRVLEQRRLHHNSGSPDILNDIHDVHLILQLLVPFL